MSAPATPRTIADVDVPAEQVAAIAVLLETAARTHSRSDRLAYALDIRMAINDDTVATDADYPDWTPGGAR